jgi:hypothetical protein
MAVILRATSANSGDASFVDDSTLYVSAPGAWTDASSLLAANWSNLGGPGGDFDFAYRLNGDNTISWRGGIVAAAGATSTIIAVAGLPVAARPSRDAHAVGVLFLGSSTDPAQYYFGLDGSVLMDSPAVQNGNNLYFDNITYSL